jgi:exonuclease SbcC
VFDTHDNARRPARTLSGGETFVASLSLALALARTTERRGGRRIDTLFIDEGFGSLDQSTLDEVMAALRRLSDEGRVIGVISHVEEMKRVIPASLEVLPSRDGAGASVRLRGVD